MYEEGSPEWHRIMAPYLENIAQVNAEVERENEEIDRELEEFEQELAEREEQAQAERERLEQERQAEQAAAQPPPNPWAQRDRRPEHFSFGPEEDDATSTSEQAPPARRSAPQPPPAPSPDPPPQPRPTPRRPPRRPAPEDDDDLSNVSWMER